MHNAALDYIRRHTASLHHHLDKNSPLAQLTQANCSVADYQTAMQGLALAYQQVDSSLGDVAEHCPADLPAYQARLPSLLEDLQQLGIATIPTPPHPLTISSSRASLLGMRYVTEGASLGAQVISRQLSAAAIASDITQAMNFWRQAAQWQGNWPALLRQLAGLQTRNEIIQAAWTARCTFHCFLQGQSLAQRTSA